MKCLFIIFSFLILLTFNAFGQQTKLDSVLHNRANQEDPGTPLNLVINHIGSEVYVRDTVSDYKIVNDSLTLLYIGGKYPNQVLTILIKGEKLNKQTAPWWKNAIGHFSGLAILYEGKPAIVIISQRQLGTVIMI
jgi:hypothetical protein